jgi:phosphoesterase RecJ-like protein
MICTENASYRDIGKCLLSHSTFLVISHIRPDGDAYGSAIAMALMLKMLGKTVTLWNEDGLLPRFAFLPGSECLVASPSNRSLSVDCVVSLDTSVRSRSGERTLGSIAGFKDWVNLDHHISNDRYGSFCHVDASVPATGEVLFDMFKANDWQITSDIAVNLFVAISTDTGSFQYLQGIGKGAKTFSVAAALITAGVNVADVSTRVYDSVSRQRIELQKRAFSGLEFSSGNRISHLSVTLKDIAESHAEPDDTEGFVEIARGINGVVAAAFFEELADGMIRVSLRSKDERLNVCDVASRFGGGGHRMAAGARVTGSLNAVRTMVVQALEEALA